MGIRGMGKKIKELLCPECAKKGIKSKLSTLYGYARCDVCDYVGKFFRDEQIAPEPKEGIRGLFKRKAPRRKFTWKQPLDFSELEQHDNDKEGETHDSDKT